MDAFVSNLTLPCTSDDLIAYRLLASSFQPWPIIPPLALLATYCNTVGVLETMGECIHAVVLGVHFYNTVQCGSNTYALWYLSLAPVSIESDVTTNTRSEVERLAFLITALTEEEILAAPACIHCGCRDSSIATDVGYIEAVGPLFAQWEAKLRCRLSIVHKMMQYGTAIKVWKLDIDANHVVSAAVPITSITNVSCISHHIVGAYLHCETWLASSSVTRLREPFIVTTGAIGSAVFNVKNSSSLSTTAANGTGSRAVWFPTFSDAEIDALHVVVKTRQGVYTYHVDDGDSQTAKRGRYVEDLTVDDVFHTVDVSVGMHNCIVHVRVLHAPFHVLWVNEDAIWNGGLVPFFSALYKRIYSGFDGLRPIMAAVFPKSAPLGSPFPPSLPSFPLMPLRFGVPPKPADYHIGSPFDVRILLDVCQKLAHTQFADAVICSAVDIAHEPFACGLREDIQCRVQNWSPWTVELNYAICGADPGVAVVSVNHYLLSVDISCVLCFAIGIHFRGGPEVETLDHLVSRGSVSACSAIAAAYSAIIATLMECLMAAGFTWAAIDHRILHFVSFRDCVIESEVSVLLAFFALYCV
uniref:Subunit of helicase-primase complex n=1 Tax=Otarine gammaherpesvirus 4 TaxID=2801541 RepID=A0A889IW10_9GAMA|nr:subunit of helicase-primase complex [Otarine gammaherpesvirus 4]